MLVNVTATIHGVPIEALARVQSAMLATGYREMQKVFESDDRGEMPIRCILCENRESYSLCASCSHVNRQSNLDFYTEGSKDEC